ncbi:MAG: MaoC family dehydratase N-terminal domain-containing protein [Dehalococcoidia bacterium]|nr:MaoC family dehydratase N-terminal domain-containing protein [Dehalococcoidia bacterium]MCA9849998.1 MaoC family dehydratase N-terminal domain-containing protein [Dehalococcoidia bacterium]MCA9855696.1 MaoC family dehydratase N-terminal domain-containing protein [Dehalococcoidia bacterium]
MTVINPGGFPVERGKIHEFANSVLDDHPLYHDLSRAHAQGLPSVIAPLTFASAASFFADEGGMKLPEGVDLRFVLHGGQEFIFERPLFAGDLLTPQPGEMRTYEKAGHRGGMMRFIETETVYRDEAGEVVVRIRSTIIQTGGVVEA